MFKRFKWLWHNANALGLNDPIPRAARLSDEEVKARKEALAAWLAEVERREEANFRKTNPDYADFVDEIEKFNREMDTPALNVHVPSRLEWMRDKGFNDLVIYFGGDFYP